MNVQGLKRIVFCFFCLNLTACGTIISLAESDYRLYAGVGRDFQTIQDGGILGVLAVVDLPLSFILDTLLLPMTLNDG